MMENTPRYPNATVVVVLSSPDGNALAIVSKVKAAMKAAGASDSEIEEFQQEALKGSYADVLETCRKYVTFETLQR